MLANVVVIICDKKHAKLEIYEDSGKTIIQRLYKPNVPSSYVPNV